MSNEILFTQENREIIEHLKNEIIKAFSETEQPAKDNIALHECEECRGVREDFANVKWQEAINELLENNYDKIPLFSPQAFNYFLPAYLLYTLNNFDDEFSEVCEFTLYALTPDKSWRNQNGDISSYWTEKFKLFTFAQMNSVYQFLELAKQNPIYRYNDASSIERAFDRLKEIKAAGEKLKKLS
jgi:hypothetical protein